MEKGNLLEILSEKIDTLLAQCKKLRDENEELRREIVTCKAANEAKEKELQQLRDDLTLKNMEIDEIIKKIESFVG